MYKPITTEEMLGFTQFINDHYGGDLLQVHVYLSHATTLLNFVQEEAEWPVAILAGGARSIEKEKQEVCYLLFGMSKCFLEAHLKRQQQL